MTDTPISNAVSPVVFMGSGGPDLTAPEAVERLAKYHDWRDDGDSETAATLRALSAQLNKKYDDIGEMYIQKAELEAENARLRDELADALTAIEECRDEIDQSIRNEYPYDHPVQERYRQRDFSANPARVFLERRAALRDMEPDT